MPAITIGPYDEAMLVPLVDMWRASFEFGVGIVDPHPIEAQREYFLRQVLPANVIDVALRDGEIAGFMASSRDSVAQLFVRVGCHRQGIGTRLLDLAKARSAGALWLYTFARNAVARSFYERHGFVDAGHGFENMWQLEDVRYEWRAPVSRAVDPATGSATRGASTAQAPRRSADEAMPQPDRAQPIVAVMVHVPDVDAALAWYRQAFGATRRRLPPAHDDMTVLDIGGVMVEIVPADAKVAAGAAGSVVYWHAVAFDAMLGHLLSLGATLYRGPMAIEDGMRMCQVRDPWGNCIGLRGPSAPAGG